MIFQDYTYQRINIDEMRTQIQDLIKKLEQAENYEDFYKAFQDTGVVFNHASTMEQLNFIRFTINTEDEFLSGENDFWDEAEPLVE